MSGREKSTTTSTDNSFIDQYDQYVIIMSYRACLTMNIDPDAKMLFFSQGQSKNYKQTAANNVQM